MTVDGSTSSTRILLCDDSPTERYALAHLLRQSGYDVEEAGDGVAALSFIKNSELDAILLDLNMPDIDGFAVLGYLQQHRRALPVILLSGMPLQQIQHHMHRLPTQELPPLLIKPINPDQLLTILDLQLNGGLSQLAVNTPADNGSLDVPI